MVGLFLVCYVHLFVLLFRFHMQVLCSIYLSTFHQVFSKVHPCFHKWQNFMLFYVWVIFHYITHTHTHTHTLSIRQLYLSSRIFILYLFEYYFSPLLLFFPFSTHLKGILEMLILVSTHIKLHSIFALLSLCVMCWVNSSDLAFKSLILSLITSSLEFMPSIMLWFQWILFSFRI